MIEPLPNRVQDVSLPLNPEPDTVTVDPTAAEEGVRAMERGVTVNVVCAESRVLGVSTTVYVPSGCPATVSDAEVICPFVMLQVAAVKASELLENEPELQ
jgi:hypothetical protein